MKKFFENKFTMYDAVDKTLDKHKSLVDTVPAFMDAAAKFKVLIGKIDAERMVKGRKDRGIRMDKETAQEKLIGLTLKVSGSLVAYATAAENHTLAEKARVSSSELINARDTSMPDMCKAIFDLTSGLETALEYYGLTSGVLDEFETMLATYRSLMSAPRTATTERTTAGIRLKGWFDAADLLVQDTMDKLIEFFRESAPVFYNEYKQARIIIDLGVRRQTKEGGGEE